mgnify:CR=1 FL=1
MTRLAGSNNSGTAAAVAERMGNTSSAVLVYPGGAQAHALIRMAVTEMRGIPSDSAWAFSSARSACSRTRNGTNTASASTKVWSN